MSYSFGFDLDGSPVQRGVKKLNTKTRKGKHDSDLAEGSDDEKDTPKTTRHNDPSELKRKFQKQLYEVKCHIEEFHNMEDKIAFIEAAVEDEHSFNKALGMLPISKLKELMAIDTSARHIENISFHLAPYVFSAYEKADTLVECMQNVKKLYVTAVGVVYARSYYNKEMKRVMHSSFRNDVLACIEAKASESPARPSGLSRFLGFS